MIIYHASNVVVAQPKILQTGRMLDFGTGFYATSNKEQAIRWAQRVAERREPKDQLLSIYPEIPQLLQLQNAVVK
jgi:hypothetical protein